MKFSYNWLRELTGSFEAPPAELARLITMKTAESEGVEQYGEHLAHVYAARVEEVEPIPDSHNKKVLIDAGTHGRRIVVCAAPNCRVGIVTAWVPPGTVLEGRTISKAVINGVESDGMLASGAEIGINREHEGILEFAAEPGTLIPGCTPDAIIEIDNKSLTHRPDLWGHHGMAREIAAILQVTLRDPVRLTRIPGGISPIPVRIDDYALCLRYSALVFENVTVRPSPLWLQARLQSVGLNPINNIVDVTNYVMAELAQPMHAFDAEKLHGGIVVRSARPGEQVVALNGETYALGPANLVIADEQEAVAIAGVIGGIDSAISAGTTRLVLESANFHAASIRKTSVQLKLRTDASMRFEKSQDPANTVRGLARAVALLEDVSPGIRLVGGLADARRAVTPPAPIQLPIAWLARKLGTAITAEEVRVILEALAFEIDESGGVFSVTVPSWRATKDISVKDDLLEEVGRMLGYGAITPSAPLVPATPPPINTERKFHNRLRTMVAAQGFTEVSNYSFVSEAAVCELGFDPADHVSVANPIASDQTLLRTSLLPGILSNVRENSKHTPEFRLFEIGREIHRKNSANDLPEETPMLAAAVYGIDNAIFEAKRLAECLLPKAEVRPGEARKFEHPVRAAEVIWHGESVGRLFEFHPSLVGGRTAVLELNLSQVQAVETEPLRYKTLRRYPSSDFDLSVIADLREYSDNLSRSIATLGASEVESIEFVREYVGHQVPEGKKSVSFRITVAASDRTLSSNEIASIRSRIIEGMRAAGYELRV